MRRGWWGAPSLGRSRGQGRVQGSRMGRNASLSLLLLLLSDGEQDSPCASCSTILAWARRGTGAEPAGWAALQDTGLDSGQTGEQAGGPSRRRNQLARLATHVPMPRQLWTSLPGLPGLSVSSQTSPSTSGTADPDSVGKERDFPLATRPPRPQPKHRTVRTVCTPLPCLTKRRVST